MLGRVRHQRHARGEDLVHLLVVPPLDEGRPVHHLEIDVHADLLELLLGDERDVVHPLVLLGGDEADGLALVPGLLQELLGLVLVPLVVGVAAGLRVPGFLLREGQPGVEPVEERVPHRGPHVRLDVDGRLHRLAKLHVGHETFLLVEDRHGPGVRPHDEGPELRVVLDPVVGDGLEVVGKVHLARLEAGDPRGHVRHRDPPDLVDVGDLSPAVAVGRLGPRLVVVVADHPDVDVRLPLDELEGAGADVLGDLGRRRILLGDLLRVDGGEVVRVGQGDQDDARLLLELDLHRGPVDGPHALHRGPHGLGLDGVPAPPLQRGDHVVAGHLLSVVEPDALTQLDRVREPVRAHRGKRLGQDGNRLVVLVQRVEALVDVLGDDLHEVRRGPVGVERGRIPEHGDLQHPSLLGSLRPGLEPGHGHQADDEQQ